MEDLATDRIYRLMIAQRLRYPGEYTPLVARRDVRRGTRTDSGRASRGRARRSARALPSRARDLRSMILARRVRPDLACGSRIRDRRARHAGRAPRSANPHYGFFRDELYFIICGFHPAWGYVDQPPVVPLLAAGSQLFGHSLFLLRAVPAIFAPRRASRYVPAGHRARAEARSRRSSPRWHSSSPAC